MVGSQKMARGEMSGGRRIDDHSFWAGKPSAESVLPVGAKVKQVPDVEGAGSLNKYEDTEDRIRNSQRESNKKIKGHQGRLPEYRH